MKRLIAAVFVFSSFVSAQVDWTTPTEKSGYRFTPNYEETLAYLRRVAAAAPKQVKVEEFGRTAENRPLYIVIVSKDGIFDPASLHKANRPVILVQNGIHAGEIEGKDASLALLRDIVITKRQAALIDKSVLVIIPVYNVDGHERTSKYNRINQNGPEIMGWRTNGANLNLNRDYMKADAPETRAWLKLWNKWSPDFFFDNHVTDGADYQYVVTYNIERGIDVDSGIAKWEQAMLEKVVPDANAHGALTGPYVQFVDEFDPTKGLASGQSVPRFSNGYTIVRNRPGMLVEMHMLKDYKTRVLGNYEFMRSILRFIADDPMSLIEANRAADKSSAELAATQKELILKISPTTKTQLVDFKGISYKVADGSPISGGKRIEWTGQKQDMRIPSQTEMKVVKEVRLPAAYVIPSAWTNVIDILAFHGVQMRRLEKPEEFDVDLYRCEQPTFTAAPFEGRHAVAFGGEARGDAGFQTFAKNDACKLERKRVSYSAGSAVVRTDQPLAKLIAHWLEPEAPDSALAWGFFDSIFEQKEYGEGYVIEPLAEEMMKKDPKLKEEFERKLASDPSFAKNPFARLNFFYQRSPYWDDHIGLYPVGRLEVAPKAGK